MVVNTPSHSIHTDTWYDCERWQYGTTMKTSSCQPCHSPTEEKVWEQPGTVHAIRCDSFREDGWDVSICDLKAEKSTVVKWHPSTEQTQMVFSTTPFKCLLLPCILSCFSNCVEVINSFLQPGNLHTNGFTPVCNYSEPTTQNNTNSCFRSCIFFEKVSSQWLHLYTTGSCVSFRSCHLRCRFKLYWLLNLHFIQ